MQDGIDPLFYDLLTHLHRGGAFAHFVSVNQSGRFSFWFPVGEPAELSLPQVLGCDLYFTVHPVSEQNPRSIHTKSHKENVAAINCLYAEFDDKDFAGNAGGHAALLEPPPSVIVHSGGGIHAYWLLKETFALITPTDQSRAESLQKRWQKQQGGDKGVNDIARILRIPGTMNHKYEPPRHVEICTWHPERQYELEALEALLPPAEAEPVVVRLPAQPNSRDDVELLEMARKSHNGAKFDRLWQGDFKRYYHDDHSTADLALCTMLAFWTGRDETRIDQLFRQSGLYRPEKWDRRDYRTRTIAKACTTVFTVWEPGMDTDAVQAAMAAVGIARSVNGANGASGTAVNGTNGHGPTVNGVSPAATLSGSGASASAKPQRMSDLAPQIERMLGRRMSREDKAELAALVVDLLENDKRLFWDTVTGRTYLQDDDYQVWDLQTGTDQHSKFRRFLRDAGLNSTEYTYGYVVEELCMAAMRYPTHLHQNMVMIGDALYIPCGASWYVKATTKNGLEKMPNGTDGIYFVARSAIPEWEPLPLGDTVAPFELQAMQVAIDAPPDVDNFTADFQRTLLETWLIAFMAGIRPLPLLATLGSKGGGKSMLLRSILKLLMGADQDLTTLTSDKRDFDTMVTNDLLVGLDNVDQLQNGTEWFYDSLATVATGGMNKRRQYHTLAEQVNLQIVGAVMISSRTASFARPDVAERTLPIFVRPFEDGERIADSVLLSELPRQRDAVLSWLAYHAINILERRTQAPRGLPARFQDFAQVVWAYCATIGEEPLTVPILAAWRKAQSLAVGDADPLMNAVVEYIQNDVTGLGLFDLAPKDLVERLKSAGYDLPFMGGGKRIASRLRELKSTLISMGLTLTERTSRARPYFTIKMG